MSCQMREATDEHINHIILCRKKSSNTDEQMTSAFLNRWNNSTLPCGLFHSFNNQEFSQYIFSIKLKFKIKIMEIN